MKSMMKFLRRLLAKIPILGPIIHRLTKPLTKKYLHLGDDGQWYMYHEGSGTMRPATNAEIMYFFNEGKF